MANIVKHKRGSGNDPSASDLVLGELAIRTDNGKLFTKMDSGAIAEIAGGGSDIAINTLSSSSATGGGSATFNGSAYRFTLSSPPSVSAQQLLVSIAGVIQKPVAGSGQPSEGFSISGNDIILAQAPASGTDFFILTFRSLGVSEPADNTVTNAKVASNAAIQGSKINPNFGSQNIQTTGGISNAQYVNLSATSPSIDFVDTNNNSDFMLQNANGVFKLYDSTNGADRWTVASDGTFDINGNLDANAGLDVTGNITATGNLSITSSAPQIFLTDNNANSDYAIVVNTGQFRIRDETNSANRFAVNSDGHTDVYGRLDVSSGLNVLSGNTALGGNLTLSSGRLLIGTNTEGHAAGDNLTVADTGNAGITVRSGSSNNGVLYFSDGTSGSAEYRGAVQYNHSENYLRFYSNGTERLRINSSGQLIQRYSADPYDNRAATFQSPSGVSATYISIINTETNGQSGITFGDHAGQNAGNFDGYINYDHSNQSMAFLVNGGTERMRILNDGKIGIGTSTPEGSGLDITTSRTTHYSENADQRGLANLILRQTSDAANRFVGLSFVNGGSYQAEASINLMQTGNYTGDLRFKFRTGGGSTDWRSRFRMTAAGMMGFNGNPNRYLHVSGRTDGGNFGTAAFEQNNTNNSAAVMFMSTLRNGNAGESFLQCNRDQDNNGQGVKAVFFIRTNGDCDSDTNSYGGISDIKLKENIVDAKSQWDDIKNIKVRNFNFKDNPEQKMLGVVAQEVETVSAGLVKDCPDENITSSNSGFEGTSTKSVKYSILYMKAIKCLQEAQARIETLETKVTALGG